MPNALIAALIIFFVVSMLWASLVTDWRPVICWLLGHDDEIQQPNILSGLRCARCTRVTPGWHITTRRRWKAKQAVQRKYGSKATVHPFGIVK